MLTVEKMHLMLTRPDGTPEAPKAHKNALAAAALLDLASAGIVAVEQEAAPAQARVRVVAAGTTGHPVLDAVLSQVDGLDGTGLHALVKKGKPAVQKPLEKHLIERGTLLKEKKGLLNTEIRPESTRARDEVLDEVRTALEAGGEMNPSTSLLLGTLDALNIARVLVPGAEAEHGRRELGRRILRLTRDDRYVRAVREATASFAGNTAAAALPPTLETLEHHEEVAPGSPAEQTERAGRVDEAAARSRAAEQAAAKAEADKRAAGPQKAEA
jgi:hypothetical protein